MTRRSEFVHRKAEAQQTLTAATGDRAFTTKQSGLDGVATSMIARRAPEIEPDPELDHDTGEPGRQPARRLAARITATSSSE